MNQSVCGAVVTLGVVWAAVASGAPTEAQKCEATKLSATGKYSACRLGAEKKAVLKGIAPDYTKCDAKYTAAWGKAETKYTGMCSTTGDQSAVQQRVTGDASAVRSELGGSMPTVLRRLPASGQTTAYTTGGDDGSSQAGAALNYVDNGDGTITDVTTDLVWEKKVLWDGSPDATNLHDADNCYPWTGNCHTGGAVCSVDSDCGANGPCDAGDCQTSPPNSLTIFKWVEQLNTANFAGHNDWRIPNVKELLSIVDYGKTGPAVSAAFNAAGCPSATCADMTNPACSCTPLSYYWSSTSFLGINAWYVYYGQGYALQDPKNLSHSVRAVRGGL